MKFFQILFLYTRVQLLLDSSIPWREHNPLGRFGSAKCNVFPTKITARSALCWRVGQNIWENVFILHSEISPMDCIQVNKQYNPIEIGLIIVCRNQISVFPAAAACILPSMVSELNILSVESTPGPRIGLCTWNWCRGSHGGCRIKCCSVPSIYLFTSSAIFVANRSKITGPFSSVLFHINIYMYEHCHEKGGLWFQTYEISLSWNKCIYAARLSELLEFCV